MIFHFDFLPNWLICSVLHLWYFKIFSVALHFRRVNSNLPTNFYAIQIRFFSWYHENIKNQKWWNGYFINVTRKMFRRFAFMFSLFVNL